VSDPKHCPIDVEIYDQKYTIVLRTPLEEREVRAIADELDLRMREIASVSNTADSLRIAVLTALHLAQELRELKRNCEHKATEWCRVLEQVLKK